MASVTEIKERNKAYRHTLRKLEERIVSFGQFQFPLSDLQKAGICVIPSMFECSDDLDPCFFEPYPTNLLIPPKEEFVATEFPEYNRDKSQLRGETPVERARALCYYLCRYLSAFRSPRPEVKYTVFRHSGWGFYDNDDIHDGFRGLWEYGPSMRDLEHLPQWYVEAIYHHHDTSFPHLKSVMISDIDGDDDTLFRGELLALIRMVRGRLATKIFVSHAIHPILLFSMMGTQHARILQGHFNGTELVVHRSKLYDFRHENAAFSEFFAQWFLSSPSGRTKPD